MAGQVPQKESMDALLAAAISNSTDKLITF